MDWNKSTITTDDGRQVEAVEPIIISASRSTDIPAFYSSWFMRRLEKGYLRWTNPFNRVDQYVSFSKARVIVFWSKNPFPLLHHLDELDQRGIGYYIQFTLNDYDAEKLEPAVPPLERRIETFFKLSERLGANRVIWRFDPLIRLPGTGVVEMLERVRRVGDRLLGATKRLVFSYADINSYKKVRENLTREHPSIWSSQDIEHAEWTRTEQVELAQGLSQLASTWRNKVRGFQVGTCAEEIDLSEYGIEKNRCIDDRLLAELFPRDRVLMDFLGFPPEPEPDLFSAAGMDSGIEKTKPKNLKDKGQRKACGCIMSKDVGAYNTCPHLCVYCYANTSRSSVMNMKARMDLEGDGLG